MSDSVTPWSAAPQASLFFTISQSLLKFLSIEWMMPSNHRILCRSLLLLPSIFPSIRVILLQFIYWKDTMSVLSVPTLFTSWSLLYHPDQIPPLGIYHAHFLVCGFSMGNTIQNVHWRNSKLSFGVVKSLFFSITITWFNPWFSSTSNYIYSSHMPNRQFNLKTNNNNHTLTSGFLF